MSLTHKPVELAIVGGGAAGLFAAATAAERRIPCLVLERKARIGAKLLMTANGRCNFTKDIPVGRFLSDLSPFSDPSIPFPAAQFAADALKSCPPRRVIDCFRSLGVALRRTADARMFPSDGKAATIVHAFGDLLRDREIPLLTNCPVTGLQPIKTGFLVVTRNFTLWARNVLIATGGVSYPKTGSVGDGQIFARELGHRLVPYRPGLIGLETADRRVTVCAGRRFEDGRCTVTDAGGRVLFDCRAEVDCERFGLSGSAVYNAQRFLEHRDRVRHDAAKLSVEVSFDRTRLKFSGLRPRPVKEAIVTIGGVDLRDVDPSTLQSRTVPGLYFAGEVLDLDGPTGGYNLTLAFATAFKAVTSIA